MISLSDGSRLYEQLDFYIVFVENKQIVLREEVSDEETSIVYLKVLHQTCSSQVH